MAHVPLNQMIPFTSFPYIYPNCVEGAWTSPKLPESFKRSLVGLLEQGIVPCFRTRISLSFLVSFDIFSEEFVQNHVRDLPCFEVNEVGIWCDGEGIIDVEYASVMLEGSSWTEVDDSLSKVLCGKPLRAQGKEEEAFGQQTLRDPTAAPVLTSETKAPPCAPRLKKELLSFLNLLGSRTRPAPPPSKKQHLQDEGEVEKEEESISNAQELPPLVEASDKDEETHKSFPLVNETMFVCKAIQVSPPSPPLSSAAKDVLPERKRETQEEKRRTQQRHKEDSLPAWITPVGLMVDRQELEKLEQHRTFKNTFPKTEWESSVDTVLLHVLQRKVWSPSSAAGGEDRKQEKNKGTPSDPPQGGRKTRGPPRQQEEREEDAKRWELDQIQRTGRRLLSEISFGSQNRSDLFYGKQEPFFPSQEQHRLSLASLAEFVPFAQCVAAAAAGVDGDGPFHELILHIPDREEREHIQLLHPSKVSEEKQLVTERSVGLRKCLLGFLRELRRETRGLTTEVATAGNDFCADSADGRFTAGWGGGSFSFHHGKERLSECKHISNAESLSLLVPIHAILRQDRLSVLIRARTTEESNEIIEKAYATLDPNCLITPVKAKATSSRKGKSTPRVSGDPARSGRNSGQQSADPVSQGEGRSNAHFFELSPCRCNLFLSVVDPLAHESVMRRYMWSTHTLHATTGRLHHPLGMRIRVCPLDGTEGWHAYPRRHAWSVEEALALSMSLGPSEDVPMKELWDPQWTRSSDAQPPFGSSSVLTVDPSMAATRNNEREGEGKGEGKGKGEGEEAMDIPRDAPSLLRERGCSAIAGRFYVDSNWVVPSGYGSLTLGEKEFSSAAAEPLDSKRFPLFSTVNYSCHFHANATGRLPPFLLAPFLSRVHTAHPISRGERNRVNPKGERRGDKCSRPEPEHEGFSLFVVPVDRCTCIEEYAGLLGYVGALSMMESLHSSVSGSSPELSVNLFYPQPAILSSCRPLPSFADLIKKKEEMRDWTQKNYRGRLEDRSSHEPRASSFPGPLSGLQRSVPSPEGRERVLRHLQALEGMHISKGESVVHDVRRWTPSKASTKRISEMFFQPETLFGPTPIDVLPEDHTRHTTTEEEKGTNGFDATEKEKEERQEKQQEETRGKEDIEGKEKEEEEEDSKEKAMARRATMPRSHTVAESSPSASSVKNLRQGLAGKLPFGAPMAGGRVGGHGLSLSEEDLKSMLTKGKETPKSPEPSSKDEETSAEADSNNVGEELKHATTSRPKPRRKGRVSRVSSVRLSAGMGLEKTATEGDEA
mmetsp:Transcript_21047/g.54380  ORF Transcript_21047/g.54380 Transcript_21047/m.54380 type:complete len:1283 (-) Transcript_21047:155-4003(-)